MTPAKNTSTSSLGKGPSAAPRRDLSTILGPRPKATAPLPDEPAPAPQPSTDTTPTQKRSAPARTEEAEQPDLDTSVEKQGVSAASDADLKVNRVVYLPDDITVRLAADCARHRRTRTEMVLAALEATHLDLPRLVEASMAPTVTRGELFDVVTPAGRRDQPAKRQVFITPTRQQLDIIDQLKDSSGARDRSHLIMVALDAHLT